MSTKKVRGIERVEKSALDAAIVSLINAPNGIAGVGEDGLVPASILPSSSGSNTGTLTVDFGSTFSHFAQVTPVEQAWVTADSRIVVTSAAVAGKELETALLNFSTAIGEIVPGDSFTLFVYTPVKAKGEYTFSYMGV